LGATNSTGTSGANGGEDDGDPSSTHSRQRQRGLSKTNWGFRPEENDDKGGEAAFRNGNKGGDVDFKNENSKSVSSDDGAEINEEKPLQKTASMKPHGNGGQNDTNSKTHKTDVLEPHHQNEVTGDGDRTVVVLEAHHQDEATGDGDRTVKVLQAGNDASASAQIETLTSRTVVDGKGGDLEEQSNSTNTTNSQHLQPTPSHDALSSDYSVEHEWVKLFQSHQEDGLSNTVETHYFYHMQPGLYSFILHDEEGDGLCCKYRFGW
jgi:hypothetical protein